MRSLRGTQLWSVDLPAMLAGSSYRGQFEERLMALLEKVLKAKNNTWLFVDEVHMLGERASLHMCDLLSLQHCGCSSVWVTPQVHPDSWYVFLVSVSRLWVGWYQSSS